MRTKAWVIADSWYSENGINPDELWLREGNFYCQHNIVWDIVLLVQDINDRTRDDSIAMSNSQKKDRFMIRLSPYQKLVQIKGDMSNNFINERWI